MEESINICVTCLSTDRYLVPLHKFTMLLQEIQFRELNTTNGGVCWECRSILLKYYKFKKRAKLAQSTLTQTSKLSNIKPLTSLISKTNIAYDYQYTFYSDPLTDSNSKLKLEKNIVKQEIVHTDDNEGNTSDFDENFPVIDEKISVIDENLPVIDEKLTEIPRELENVFVEVETKLKDNLLENEIKINFAEVIFDETHDLSTNIESDGRKNKQVLKRTKDIKIDVKNCQEKFTEVILSKEEMEKAREEKRNHYNFKKIPFKCESCVLGFTRKDTYSLHMKKKHDESIGDQICDVCSIRFRHTLALCNHKRKHYVVYRCRLCKYESHEFVSIVNHCKTKHIADSLNRIHCQQCHFVAKTSDDLEKHLQTDHTIFCDCGVKFNDKSNLRRHMVRAHSILRNFICDICKKTFKTKTRLESHMVTHSGHIAKKLAYCQQCKIQYKNIQVYRHHLKSSANHSEGYPCSKCNKKFRSKGYLKQHYDFYHLRISQYNCEICNKLFISKWRLHNHKQLHHGLTRPRNHSCNICGKKFFTSTTLRNHQFTHSDQRSFMCEDCGDTFKQRAALYTHTRLVHRDKGGRRKKRDC